MGKPVAGLVGASADPELGHGEAQEDLPVQALNVWQAEIWVCRRTAGSVHDEQGDAQKARREARKARSWLANQLHVSPGSRNR